MLLCASAPCKSLCEGRSVEVAFGSYSAQALCASDFAQVAVRKRSLLSAASAWRKLLCASALRNLLCAAHSAQVLCASSYVEVALCNSSVQIALRKCSVKAALRKPLCASARVFMYVLL